jgi:cyclic pyranopterin phosphate synthase
MRCVYCMQYNNTDWIQNDSILTYKEIVRLVTIFSDLGIEKIRITGGEPTVRANLENLVNSISHIKGIQSISMTTNGLLLQDKVRSLKKAGLGSVNISLDTFRADRFKAMSGVEGIDRVFASINAADAAGLKVKINTVIMRGWNDDEVVNFAKFARDTGYTVRFIEFMPLDGAGLWTPQLVFTKKEMIERIENELVHLSPLNNNSSEPAMLYSFIDKIGTIGFIPSITEPFCRSCDRIRLTSDGRILTCLFETPGYDVKEVLRNGKHDDGHIRKYIIECIKKKPEGLIKIINTNALKPTLNVMHKIGG